MLAAALAAGCDAVTEDRTISFSGSGEQLAFQHGADGVFLTDPRSGRAEKVLDPDRTVIAVSTPQWSRDDIQAIFATARTVPPPQPPAGNPAAAGAAPAGGPLDPSAWSDSPDGRAFFRQPVEYTCWLVKRAPKEGFEKPTELFSARVDHAGYVAAALAVRWHPTQDKVLYIQSAAGGPQKAAWLFDPATKSSTQVFPTTQTDALELVADFTPDGKHLLCTVQNNGAAAETWIMQPDGSGAWRLAEPKGAVLIDRGLSALLAGRPVCSQDGRSIAFVRGQRVLQARLADGKVETVFVSQAPPPIVDLHWSRDGARLGFVEGGADPALILADGTNKTQRVAGEQYVRHFAGWNASGDKLAYVTAADKPPREPASWATLLLANPLARDTLVVADGRGGGSRGLASGFRFTFANWSPRRDEISTWVTFSPSYRSVVSVWAEMMGNLGVGLGLRLRSGDPAALIDAASGAIRWMPINAEEESQVGTWYLVHRDYATARAWYAKADAKFPKLGPLRPGDIPSSVTRQTASRRTFEIFYWYCLTKLGEAPQAAVRREAFDKAHRIDWPTAEAPVKPPGAAPQPASPWTTPAARRSAERYVAILKGLSATEVLLSVGTSKEAEAFLNREAAATSRLEQIGDLTALTQVLLLRGGNLEFANLVADRLVPLLAEELDDQAADWSGEPRNDVAEVRTFTTSLLGHAVGPLFCPDFLKQLPERDVEALAAKWKTQRDRSKSAAAQLGLDLMLAAASERLGRNADQAAAERRVAQNPAAARLLPAHKPAQYFAEVRKLGTTDWTR
jgi:hypothetical protein